MRATVIKTGKLNGLESQLTFEQAVTELHKSGAWKGTRDDIAFQLMETGRMWTNYNEYEYIPHEN